MSESGFTTTCPREGCGKGFVGTTGPYQAGPPDPDAKPDKVRCSAGHVFPVQEREQTSGGQTQYRLGPEIEPE